jgi:hypothetical protein
VDSPRDAAKIKLGAGAKFQKPAGGLRCQAALALACGVVA